MSEATMRDRTAPTRAFAQAAILQGYRLSVGCLVATLGAPAWLLQRRGPVQHDFVRRCRRAGAFRNRHQEALAVARDVEEQHTARRLEQGLRWAADAERRLCFDGHGHEGAVRGEVEELLGVGSPDRAARGGAAL